MADIGLSISLDTSSLQSGARSGAKSLGELAEAMSKMSTDAEKNNALADYFNSTNAAVTQLVKNLENVKPLSLPNATALQNPTSQPQFVPSRDEPKVQVPQPQFVPPKNIDVLTDRANKASKIFKDANVNQLRTQLQEVKALLDESYHTLENIDSSTTDFANLKEGTENLESAKKQLEDLINKESKNAKSPATIYTLAQRSVTGMPALINNFGSGNFASSVIGGIAQGARSVREKSSEAEEKGGIMEKLGKAGTGLATATPVAGAILGAGNALANQWEKASAPAVDAQTMYGENIENKSAAQNSAEIRNLYARASQRNFDNNTGYTTAEYLQTMNNAARYGVSNASDAMAMTDSVMKWQRFSGADRSALLNIAGTTARYGNENASTAIKNAYAGLKESGLNKGQFDEFLSGMQTVIENGIAQGFVKSSKEVASDLSMLSKLSGDSELWKGEQGAQRLMQMSGGVSASTALQSTAHILNYQTAEAVAEDYKGKGQNLKNYLGKDAYLTGTYADTMQVLEKGLTGSFLEKGFDTVERVTGLNYNKKTGEISGDTAGAVEWFRQQYNLNYTGASQVLGMYQRYKSGEIDEKQLNKEIEAFNQDTSNKSNETRMIAVVEKIKNDVAQLGEKPFDVKLSIIEGTLELIDKHLIKDGEKATPDDFNALKNIKVDAPEIDLSEVDRGTEEVRLLPFLPPIATKDRDPTANVRGSDFLRNYASSSMELYKQSVYDKTYTEQKKKGQTDEQAQKKAKSEAEKALNRFYDKIDHSGFNMALGLAQREESYGGAKIATMPNPEDTDPNATSELQYILAQLAAEFKKSNSELVNAITKELQEKLNGISPTVNINAGTYTAEEGE